MCVRFLVLRVHAVHVTRVLTPRLVRWCCRVQASPRTRSTCTRGPASGVAAATSITPRSNARASRCARSWARRLGGIGEVGKAMRACVRAPSRQCVPLSHKRAARTSYGRCPLPSPPPLTACTGPQITFFQTRRRWLGAPAAPRGGSLASRPTRDQNLEQSARRQTQCVNQQKPRARGVRLALARIRDHRRSAAGGARPRGGAPQCLHAASVARNPRG